MNSNTVSEALTRLEAQMRPPDDYVARAQRVVDAVTDLVGAISTETRIHGTLARGTAILPLTEVDVVVVLDESLSHLRETPRGPLEAIRTVQQALRSYTGTIETLARNPSSVRFRPEGSPAADVTPAFRVADHDSSSELLYPFLPKMSWRTIKFGDVNSAIEARDQECQGEFRRQVRLMKATYARLEFGAASHLPGSLIEALAYHAIDRRYSDEEATRRTFELAADRLGDVLLDPTGSYNMLELIRGPVAMEWKRISADALEQVNRATAGGSDRGSARARNAWSELLRLHEPWIALPEC